MSEAMKMEFLKNSKTSKPMDYENEDWHCRLTKIVRQESFAAWIGIRRRVTDRYWPRDPDKALDQKEIDLLIECLGECIRHEETLRRMQQNAFPTKVTFKR